MEKPKTRPGRKMGHINIVDSSARAALKKALQWRKEFKL
ncbi:MAG: hypothetical protein HC902_14240 [Calothrix sp. SM1_5_4]|nr:hypothetical protein [Calothrix sp. SM1_5_4]